MITLVDLSRSPKLSAYVSREFFERAGEVLAKKGRILVYFNRRGAFRAYVCQDCSFASGCPRCDLSLAYHASPERRLLCHHCGHREPVPETCPKCGGTRMRGSGIGIQSFEEELRRAFPEAVVVRIDSDAKKSGAKDGGEQDREADVVLSTSLFHKHDPGRFDLVVFPCLESELVAGEYDVEERVYAHVRYASLAADDALIQTYRPESPLAKSLMDGNYREFLTRTLAERKKFRYPPYSEIAYVTVSERTRERAEEAVARLKNKLEIVENEGRFGVAVLSDPSLLTKRADEWFGKIVVKGDRAAELLESLRIEIVRNRNVRLEWK